MLWLFAICGGIAAWKSGAAVLEEGKQDTATLIVFGVSVAFTLICLWLARGSDAE